MNLLTFIFFHKQRKTLGEPTGDVVDGPGALEFGKYAIIAESSPKALQQRYVLAARDDGLVREEKENRIVSRDDTTELTEVEDIKHFGDFSDKVSETISIIKFYNESAWAWSVSNKAKTKAFIITNDSLRSLMHDHIAYEIEDLPEE